MSRAFRVLRAASADAYLIGRQVVASLFRGQGRASLISLLRLCRQHLRSLRLSFISDTAVASLSDSDKIARLRETTTRLHALLPKCGGFRYSILIPTYRADPRFFEKALRAALAQSAPHFEVLVGFDGEQPAEVIAVFEHLRAEYSQNEGRLRAINCDRGASGGGIARTTNALADTAAGSFLLLMDHDDWIRPDLLYRYEQTLLNETDPHNLVLFCNEYQIDEHDNTIPGSHQWKAEVPTFPYLFINTVCHALLVPKDLWRKVGGERPVCDGAQDYDLTLRLDAAGARFQNVPFFLYAWRSHSRSTAQNLDNKDYATAAGIRALTDYAAAKKLDWEVTAGYGPTIYRAIPKVHGKPIVHAVMLYRDQGPLTLRCAKSLLAQVGVEVLLTAIDNGSCDRGIERALADLGAEVIRIDEGFNYSRLNNRAVAESRKFQNRLADDCPLLFSNNDVELQSDALFELCRWLDQPRVGIVGARLHYPNGTVQHGGIELSQHAAYHDMVWFHTDAGTPFEAAGFSRVIRTTIAVTAACALMKTKTFLDLGGFDEIFYPIAYSDTNLCSRIRRLGLYCLYTPYAIGTHYEGATRGTSNIEDAERSRWLHDTTLAKRYADARVLVHRDVL